MPLTLESVLCDMTKRNAIPPMKEEFAAYRRAMHENPGTLYEEFFASDLIAERLSAWGIPHVRGIGKTGIIATIEGQKNTSGKAIGLRADIDALPVDELSGQPWSSKVPGKMHACGHDGHTAILLGAAKYLNETKNFDGKVHLIFQPAEEGGRGAFAMIEDGLFKGDFKCDAVYALHNWPYLPVGKAGIRPGPIMAAVDEFDVAIKGVGGHAAYPHKCVDSIAAGVALYTAFQTIISRNVPPLEPAVLSVTNFKAGTGAFNVIPDAAHISGTVRTYDRGVRDMIEATMQRMVDDVAKAYGVTMTFKYDRNIDATINDPVHTQIAADAMARIIGAENVDTNTAPSMGGEDFGGMLAVVPGAYINVGQGTPDPNSPHNQGLHHPRYDFNDEVLPIAIDYFVELAESSMPLKA